jgi:hypothetical protein
MIAYFNLCRGLTASPPPVAALPAGTKKQKDYYFSF